MIVILEGMERTGKSTLAKEFEGRGFVNFKDVNRFKELDTKSVKHRLDSTLSFIRALNNSGVDVVMDRYHISEMVYANFYRGAKKDETAYNFLIDAVLSEIGAVIVFCERKIDEEYMNAFPNNEFSMNEVRKISEMFRYLIDKSEIKEKYNYEFNKETPGSFVDKFLERRYLNEHIEEKSVSFSMPNKAFEYDFYLASPFFNNKQVERMERVLSTLRERGFVVYAPYEHGIVASEEPDERINEVFRSNVDAIRESRRVIAITDEKDMGTIWEAGFAYGIGKEIIYYAETLGDNPFNLMLSESGIGIFTKFKKFKGAVETCNFYQKESVNHE